MSSAPSTRLRNEPTVFNIGARGPEPFEWEPKLCAEKRVELEEWAEGQGVAMQVCRNTVGSEWPSCSTTRPKRPLRAPLVNSPGEQSATSVPLEAVRADESPLAGLLERFTIHQGPVDSLSPGCD